MEPTLRSIAQALQQSLVSDELGQHSGFFQSLDPRVRVLTVLELLVSASLTRTPWVIAAIYLLALAIAWRSGAAPRLMIRRVWLAMAVFTVPIALPGLLLIPGPTWVDLPFGLAITKPGAVAVLFLLLRVSSSVMLGLLLIHTTPWTRVLGALQALRVPRAFVLVLGMTHRYIYLLLRIANDMFMSRQSRIVGRLPTRDSQQLVGAAAGALLQRSLHLSEDVYMAMQSRGFRGTLTAFQSLRMQPNDWIALLVFTAISAVSIWLTA